MTETMKDKMSWSEKCLWAYVFCSIAIILFAAYVFGGGEKEEHKEGELE